jgi:hydrogenase expression/formation protein HypE
LSAALNEIAETAGWEIAIDESAVPVAETVRGACEILGFDPLYVANEGRFMVILPEPGAARALELLRQTHPDAAPIGRVTDRAGGRVLLKSRIGATRILDLLTGEQLPRIC